MPFTQAECDRIAALYAAIENNKAHKCAAPTYKDSPYLAEMAAIAAQKRDTDAAARGDLIAVYTYLTDCYDRMGREGMSVKWYPALLSAHVRQVADGGVEEEEDELDDCFYRAVKARNTYAPDDCADLAALVRGTIPEERISLLLSAAQNACRQSIRQDPVEMTDEYLAVIDEVERRIAETQTVDICFAYWHLKAMFLWEHDIPWRSPAALNPNVMFD